MSLQFVWVYGFMITEFKKMPVIFTPHWVYFCFSPLDFSLLSFMKTYYIDDKVLYILALLQDRLHTKKKWEKG